MNQQNDFFQKELGERAWKIQRIKISKFEM
jgi:hypothetical protein